MKLMDLIKRLSGVSEEGTTEQKVPLSANVCLSWVPSSDWIPDQYSAL